MKDKVVFKVDEFTDFAGAKRFVTMCAVSTIDESDTKILLLGVAVQNPSDLDNPNLVLSKTIAEGKARRNGFGMLIASSKGLINKPVVDALLGQEMKYFKQNPGKYLAGYDKDKELFEINPERYKEKYDVNKNVFN